MLQHYVLIRNPYARKNVFRCVGDCPCADAQGAVTAYTVLSVRGCYPRGCTPTAAPKLLLNIDQYARFERDLDEYDYLLNLFFGTQVQLTGTVNEMVPRMNRYVPTILNGYMIRLDLVALTEHVRFAEVWMYLSADDFERYELQHGDRITAQGRFFVNTQEDHRVEIKRVTRLVVERPFGRWDRMLQSARTVAETLRLPVPGNVSSAWTPWRS